MQQCAAQTEEQKIIFYIYTLNEPNNKKFSIGVFVAISMKPQADYWTEREKNKQTNKINYQNEHILFYVDIFCFVCWLFRCPGQRGGKLKIEKWVEKQKQ